MGQGYDYWVKKTEETTRKLLSGLFNPINPGNPDIDIVCFTDGSNQKGKLSNGNIVKTVPVGRPKPCDIGIKIDDSTYVVNRQYLKEQTVDGNPSNQYILLRDTNPTSNNYNYWVRSLQDATLYPLSIADLYSISGTPYDPTVNSIYNVSFTPNGKHLVICGFYGNNNQGLGVFYVDNITYIAKAYVGYIKNFSLGRDNSGNPIINGTRVTLSPYDLGSQLDLTQPEAPNPVLSLSVTTTTVPCPGASITRTTTQNYELFAYDGRCFTSGIEDTWGLLNVGQNSNVFNTHSNLGFVVSNSSNGLPVVDFIGKFNTQTAANTFIGPVSETITAATYGCICPTEPQTETLGPDTVNVSYTSPDSHCHVPYTVSSVIVDHGTHCDGIPFDNGNSSSASYGGIAPVFTAGGNILNSLQGGFIAVTKLQNKNLTWGNLIINHLESFPSSVKNEEYQYQTVWISTISGFVQGSYTHPSSGDPNDQFRYFINGFRSKENSNTADLEKGFTGSTGPNSFPTANHLDYSNPYGVKSVSPIPTTHPANTVVYSDTHLYTYENNILDWNSMFGVKATGTDKFQSLNNPSGKLTLNTYQYQSSDLEVHAILSYNGPDYNRTNYTIIDWISTK